MEDRSTPAVFTVLNTAESGTGSLREAIAFANKLPGPDVIRFAPSVTGSINLLGEMLITEPVTIEGPGASVLTVANAADAASTSRVFNINQATAGSFVTISGLTLTGGKVAGGSTPNGGAIRNANASLFLNNVIIEGNSTSGAGGGIALETQDATLSLFQSTIRENSSAKSGGGVAVVKASGVTIDQSTFNNNKAALNGGGVSFANGGSLNLNRSTFFANQAGTNPGEVGGGLSIVGAVNTTIVNSTFSGNSAASGGGIAAKASGLDVPVVQISNSTFTLNTATVNAANSAGGIAQLGGAAAWFTINSTAIAQNVSALTKARDFSSASNSVNLSNSFLGVHEGPGLTITGSGNKTGTDAFPEDAKLGSLQRNGGLPVLTHAPLPASPLIGAGSNLLGLTTDQRGVTRSIGTTDIGAVEGNGPVATLTSAPAVTVAGGTSYFLTVTYEAANTAIIDASKLGVTDLLISGPAGVLTIDSVSGVSKSGTPLGIVTAVTYKVTPPGGAWAGTHNGPYTVNVKLNEVFDNQVTAQAVTMPSFIGEFNVVIPRTFLVTNLDDTGPGSLRDALTLANADMDLYGLSTKDTINFLPGLSGTINLNSPLEIRDSVTINGTGAKLLFLNGQNLDRVFTIDGPGQLDVAINNLAIQGGAPTMGHGGGISVADEILTLDTVQVFSNSTADPAGKGGGIAIGQGGLLRLLNSLVANNTSSTDGGGIFLDDQSSFYIFNSSIIGNTSGSNGGGIAFNGLVANGTLPTDFVDSELRLINSTIGQNLSNKSGGGIALNISSGSLRATNSTIAFNTANQTGANLGGGGIHRTGVAGGIILENTVVAQNTNATARDIAVDAGFTTVIADHSFIGSKTGLVVTGLGNLGGTQTTPLNPQLGSLTINGKFSGILFNYEPLPGSPLIDAGNNVTTTALGLTVDQRSAPFVRVFNGKVDIGAIERQPRPNFGMPTVAPTMAPPASFVEGGGPVFVDTSLNVFDNVDDPQQFSKVTVQITGNYQSGADVLSVTNVGAVTSSFNAATGTLTLTTATKDSAANFSATLATLKFNNTSPAPTLMDRTLTLIATDATDNPIPTQSSAPVTRTVTITGVNQPPVITVPSGSFTVEVTKSIVITGLSVSDVDVGSGMISVTVSVPPLLGTFNGVGFTSGQGTESITVTDTLANVNTALSTLTFTAGTTLGVVTVTVDADDLGNTPGPNQTDSKTFNISISTAPPVLTISSGDVTYFERQQSPAFDNIDKFLVVTDDSGNLGGAFVQITSGFQPSEDELYLLGTPASGITADTSVPGKITFTGLASTADYQAILRQVAFKNSSFDPNTTPRVVTFSVQDPTDPVSVTGKRTINIVAVNDPPVFVSVPTGPFSLATNATFNFTGSKLIQIADPDSRNQPEQIFLSVIAGSLSVTPFGSTTVTGNGTTTITMKGTVTELNNTLSTLAFQSPANAVLVTLSGGVNDLGNSGTGGAQSSDLPPVVLNVLGAPKVNSMTLLSKNPSKLDTVEFLVNFDQPVTGVDIGDFQVSPTGLVGATVMSVTGSGANYTVSVSTGTGSGALRLDLIDNDSITNGATPLGGVGVGNGNFTSGPLANIDRLGPIVTVNRAPGQAATTKDSPIRFVITFSEPVTGFTASNLAVSPAGLTANLTGSGANYIVAITGMTTASTVSVTVPAGVVADELGNLSSASTGTNTVEFDPNFGVPPPPPPAPPVVPPPPAPPTVPPPPVVPPTNRDFLAVAPAAGGGPIIKVYSTDGKQRFELVGGDPNSRDGLTVATGDVTGDGIDDIIVGAGPGTPPLIRIFNGANGFQIASILAFAESFTGGINVAAGDVNGDGKADIIVGAGFGGGPHIRVFDSTGGQLATFFAYAADFRGGVNVAAGDLDGDGKAEVIAGAGNGGGPHVRTFRGDGTPLATFFAYDPNFRGGVFVAAGDIDGNGTAELITGTGFGGGAHVRVFSGLNAEPIGGFFAYDSTFRGGVRVAAQDIDGDGKKEIVTSPGPGGGPNVRVFTTSFTSNPPPTPPNQTPAPVAPPVLVRSFFAFEEDFFGGVFIG